MWEPSISGWIFSPWLEYSRGALLVLSLAGASAGLMLSGRKSTKASESSIKDSKKLRVGSQASSGSNSNGKANGQAYNELFDGFMRDLPNHVQPFDRK